MSKPLRITVGFFSAIVACGALQAVFELTPGAQYSVLSSSGLNLRQEPSPKGKKIGLAPFGDQVTVTETTATRFDSEKISGFWVKVRAGSLEGYAFSGYLSRLPAPPKTCSGLKHYLDSAFGARPEKGGAYDYGTGGSFAWLGGDVYRWEVERVSPEEIFLLARHCREIKGKQFTLGKDSDTYAEIVGQMEVRIFKTDTGAAFVKDL